MTAPAHSSRRCSDRVLIRNFQSNRKAALPVWEAETNRMTDQTPKVSVASTAVRVKFFWGILTSVLLVAMGMCFAASCVSIYQSGASPFTRESIALHVSRFSVLIWVTVTAIVGGAVLAILWPDEKKRPQALRDPAAMLASRARRLDLAALPPETREGMQREAGIRLFWGILAAAVWVLGSLPTLIWCLDRSHFTVEALHENIVAVAVILLPSVAVILGVSVLASYRRAASYGRETALCMEASVAQRAQGIKAPASKGQALARRRNLDPRILWGTRGALLAVGLLFVVLGILNGGMADVLGKAVRICTECIGLG